MAAIAPDEPSLSILLINHLWLAAELRALGHHVVTASWMHANADVCFERYSTLEGLLDQLPVGFLPNRIVYYDDSHLPSVLGLERAAVPTVFFSVDAHHHHQWHRYFAAGFDLTLVAQRDYLTKLCWELPSEVGTTLRWFPVWTPAVLKPHAEKSVAVCFRGTLDPTLHPHRHRFFEALQRLVPVDAAAGPYWRDYPKAKIVVNQTISGDLNFRVFEALSAGALLITPRIGNGLAQLFQEEIDLVTYREGDVDDAADKIRFYLAHDEERERIAASGRARVLAHHTAAVRASELGALLGQLKKRPIGAPNFIAGVLESMTATHVLRENGSEAIIRMLAERCVEHFIKSAEQHELLNDDFRAQAVVAKMLLRRFVDPSECLSFSERIAQAYPQDIMLALSFAEELLLVGRKQDAELLAENFSDRPIELLKAVPKLMGEVMSSVKLPV